MTRLRLINFLTYFGIALLWIVLMFWMIDKTVSRYQERWERQTSGMASPRVSSGD